MKTLILGLILSTASFAQRDISCIVGDLYDPTFFMKDLDSEINNKVIVDFNQFIGDQIFIGKQSFSTDKGDQITILNTFGNKQDLKFINSSNQRSHKVREFRIIVDSLKKSGQFYGKNMFGENELIASLVCK
jgi:hypothetical protein